MKLTYARTFLRFITIPNHIIHYSVLIVCALDNLVWQLKRRLEDSSYLNQTRCQKRQF